MPDPVAPVEVSVGECPPVDGTGAACVGGRAGTLYVVEWEGFTQCGCRTGDLPCEAWGDCEPFDDMAGEATSHSGSCWGDAATCATSEGALTVDDFSCVGWTWREGTLYGDGAMPRADFVEDFGSPYCCGGATVRVRWGGDMPATVDCPSR